MDLSQTKLSKSEWASVEIPVSDQEKRVISLITEGFLNPDIRSNRHLSLIKTMKVDATEEMEWFLYKTYFFPKIATFIKADKNDQMHKKMDKKIKPPNKADQIRIQKLDATIESQQKLIFDFILLDVFAKSANETGKGALYTLLYLRRLTVAGVNRFLLENIDQYLAKADTSSRESICDVFTNSTTYIERNKSLMEYADETLYSHQRDLFRIFSDKKKRDTPKCILYMAPTGTGKTLSPIGLSQEYKVLFVCAARHVGLALAKSAISVGKRVAFAFGCETAADIRLHYFAAADYTVNRKSGGIYKVDNSNGIRVEIMICDVASYLVAMYYMKSFHSVDKIVTYWDEPTIGLDKVVELDKASDEQNDDLHNLIHRVWSKNQIPNIVLSCATLPKPDEIGGALQDFKSKFTECLSGSLEPEIHVIDSHDCKKTISLLNKEGKIALPHLLFADYSTLIMDCVDHCDSNRSLLRYFDVAEIIRFAEKVQSFLREDMRIYKWFKSIDAITLNSIKMYYLTILRELPADQWRTIFEYMTETLKPRFERGENVEIRKIKSECKPTIINRPETVFVEIMRQNSMFAPPPKLPANPATGILLTTSDAHTLTDGPTIYLAEDIEKIGRFYIQQSKIPDTVFSSIQQKIDRNNQILKQIKKMEQEVDAKTVSTTSSTSKSDEKSSKKAEKEPASKEVQRMLEQIQEMRMAMQTVHLNSMYIPNTRQHLEIWAKPYLESIKRKNGQNICAFVPNVDEEDVREIMALDVENQQKLLLILGIGVFSRSSDSRYAEIMKRLAYEQRLFLIIASSDYIYGTNYQFCHGFIGKDLTNMTQQKTIQAIGRIGRNNIQQEYTVRFRDDGVLERLFRRSTENLEATMMNRLFCSDD
jgi:hypothetical protein